MKRRIFATKDHFEKVKQLLVLVIIPVAFTLIFSKVYSNVYVQEIPLAVLDLDNTSTSRAIIREFEKSAGFHVNYFVNTQKELNNDLLAEKIDAGLVIPDGFEKKIKKKESPSVLFLMDGSNIVIGNNAYSYASTILNTISAGIELQYLQGGGIVEAEAEGDLKTLTFADRVLYDPHMGYFTFMFAGFLAIFIQQTFLSVMGPVFVEEKLNRCKMASQNRKSTIIKQLMFCIGLNFVGALLSIVAAHFVGGYPIRGSVSILLLLQLVFMLGLIPMTLLIASFMEDKASCAQFVMCLSIPTILTSGAIWPVFNMPSNLLAIIKLIWPMYYYVLPAREVMLKGAGLPEVHQYIAGGITFALIWIPISIFLFWTRCEKRNLSSKFVNKVTQIKTQN